MFLWTFILRKLFTSPLCAQMFRILTFAGSLRHRREARHDKQPTKLAVEALEDRTLPSAEPMGDMVQQQVAQLLAVEQNEVTIFVGTVTQEFAQVEEGLQQEVANLIAYVSFTLDPHQASPNPPFGSGAATTDHNVSSQQPNLALQQTGHGSGSGAPTTTHGNTPPDRTIKPMVGPDAGGGGGSGGSPDATVSGQVWLDSNGDGKLNNNELGFSGITVELDVEGQGWFYTTTDAAQTGINYSFPVYVPEGTMIDYQITVVIPQNDWATIEGTDSVINSNGVSPIYTLAPGDVVYIPAGIRSMNVTTLQDDASAPIQNQVTLRDAIETGNNGPPAPAVTFGPNVTGTISLQAALPAIQASYNIIGGPAVTSITVDGNSKAGSIFTVNAGVTSRISLLTISGGSGAKGGGILNKGNLSLNEDNVWNNGATDGGGIFNSSGAQLLLSTVSIGANTAGANGGGLENWGTVNISEVTVIDENTAVDGGGGIENYPGAKVFALDGTTKIYDNSLSSKSATGGGVDNDGTFFMNHGGSINGNIAQAGGGGLANGGTMSLSGVGVFDNQTIANGGGGIYNFAGKLTITSDTTIGDDSDVFPNKAPFGGGLYMNGGTAKVSGLIAGNVATSTSGGGIYIKSGNLTLNGAAVNGNAAPIGGGMFINGGTVKVTAASIYANQAQASSGGGIYVAAGSLTMTGKYLLTENKALFGSGGGMKIDGGKVTLSGGTISYNRAGVSGGGIYNSAGTLTLKKNVQVSSNNAKSQGGGMYLKIGSTTSFPGMALDCTIQGNLAANVASGDGVYLQLIGAKFAVINNWTVNTVIDNDDKNGVPVMGP